jgi:hypothetical protein
MTRAFPTLVRVLPRLLSREPKLEVRRRLAGELRLAVALVKAADAVVVADTERLWKKPRDWKRDRLSRAAGRLLDVLVRIDGRGPPSGPTRQKARR